MSKLTDNAPIEKMDGAPIFITKHSPAFWRVTLDNPPINLMSPEMISGLQQLMGTLEADKEVKVIVFDSANEEYFISHYDVLRAAEVPFTSGEHGYHQWVDVASRLHNLEAVTIASVRGRNRGVGSELMLACDMRFASEKAIFGHLEMGMGLVPGGGCLEILPFLAGRARALEVVLSSDDFDAKTAELYGWVNRTFSDADLDEYVNTLAIRISGFEMAAIQEAKSIIDRRLGTGQKAQDIQESIEVFYKLFQRPAAGELLKKLVDKGFQEDGDCEARLGYHLGTLADYTIKS
jgi:enoyl-CoA hydratase/carnithine racemase